MNFMPKTYDTISAEPVKSFFVEMLTRDIQLEDAILDLLDNCVDGILRSNEQSNKEKPYDGYYAKIEFSKDSFTIRDNCGGIPVSLHGYAFRMGRPRGRLADAHNTVGVYGIGMKRAIFKIGKRCIIETKNNEDAYRIEFTPEWIADENEWHIPVKSIEKEVEGTTITVRDLHKEMGSLFEDDLFFKKLFEIIKEQYAIILEKGLKVSINGKEVKPLSTKLVFSKDDQSPSIRPFIFEGVIDGVEVFLTVGFTRPIPSDNETLDEKEQPRYSSQNAGWTIICNDRVVLYCDRSELTGWGEAGVPRYHTQFIAIAGMVEFRSADAAKLPTTTTKRGIDASSTLYLKIKNKMREGMKRFTDYTNKWKDNIVESKKHFDSTNSENLSLDAIKAKSEKLLKNPTKQFGGQQYVPNLPKPRSTLDDSLRRVTFSVKKSKIAPVAEYLEMDSNSDVSEVGKECFELIYREATS